jgi:hypothetical protein
MTDAESPKSSSADTGGAADRQTSARPAACSPLAEEIARQAAAKPAGVLAEMLALLRENKKWWLLPIIVMLLFVAGLMFLSSTAVAPFIYTIF